MVLAVSAHADTEVRIESGAGLGAERETEIRELVEEADVSATVVALESLPREARRSPHLLASQMLAEASPGVKVVLVYGADSLPAFGVATRQGFDGSTNTSSALQATDFTDDPAADEFVALVDMVLNDSGDAGVQAAIEKSRADRADRAGEDVAPQRIVEPSRTVRGVQFAAIALAGGLVVWFLMLRGLAVLGWWRRRRRTEVLTSAADVAASRNLAEQAQSDLLGLGAAIDAHPMRGDDDLQAWHRVLDAYDTATRLADGRDAADRSREVVEACARGRAALADVDR